MLNQVTSEQFEMFVKTNTVYLTTILQLLLDKKVFTEEEFNQYVQLFKKQTNQEMERIKQANKKEFEKQYPLLSQLLKLE